ncbi:MULTISPECIES: cytochrome o ubiquinol/quinol oxidase subunit IV [Sphingobium]|uniref:cytochrome o ubiquinol oxidase subunit IV n=1 Tax=Sphingobium TaxID=165695 RepID=UPI0015EB8E4F|nr:MULTISPECIES: cytochrome C oxidase subunit IV family protein [Sphingobium]MCW2362805.1 cytochrome o ubiquinol oxidase operon protein cyoD [Sphingobium sp. B10D3B]MCW2400515.1 cytochrome o ubiquinol oxidase operon protein cyoD [Sphingobium sp. B10D7B]MCW2407494.1 cytochrome o ubiquinol oxidase operon protein cyoD [Sphingobium xanthum]
MSERRDDPRRETRGYVLGYAAALLLTSVAFALVRWPVLASTATYALVLALALIQIVVQFRCFLHIGLKRSTRDDLQLILFSSLIIALMVGGTLVILFNLRMRMM